ncbi:imine reductase family protein [Streptomyces atratus]|uniref:imine reductase family protein n=1 Tax=Streptomyces atratus TaxID=1893 RepID=UPI00365D1EDB
MVPVEVAGGPQALIFYAGSRTAYDRYEAVLKALGAGAPLHGPDHALAAAYDMAMPDFFHGSMAGPVHAFALARAENIPAAAIAPYLRTIVAGTAADNRILVPDSELAALRVESGGAGEWRGILVRLRAVLDATGAPTLC